MFNGICQRCYGIILPGQDYVKLGSGVSAHESCNKRSRDRLESELALARIDSITAEAYLGVSANRISRFLDGYVQDGDLQLERHIELFVTALKLAQTVLELRGKYEPECDIVNSNEIDYRSEDD